MKNGLPLSGNETDSRTSSTYRTTQQQQQQQKSDLNLWLSTDSTPAAFNNFPLSAAEASPDKLFLT
jgi:hypothetical protein